MPPVTDNCNGQTVRSLNTQVMELMPMMPPSVGYCRMLLHMLATRSAPSQIPFCAPSICNEGIKGQVNSIQFHLSLVERFMFSITRHFCGEFIACSRSFEALSSMPACAACEWGQRLRTKFNALDQSLTRCSHISRRKH